MTTAHALVKQPITEVILNVVAIILKMMTAVINYAMYSRVCLLKRHWYLVVEIWLTRRSLQELNLSKTQRTPSTAHNCAYILTTIFF